MKRSFLGNQNGFVAEKNAQELKISWKFPFVRLRSTNKIQNYPYTSLSKNNMRIKVCPVDDVLNSGTTLIYAIRHFLDVPLKNSKQQS
jgi:pyrimidine operon attenuation protein/uracil phosphoribosyltransferase